jgi:hypothetical protein
MIRTYARIAAVVLLAVGVAGLVVLGWKTSAAFFHLGLGLLFAYAGFWQKDTTTVRLLVGGLGVLLVAVKASIIVAPLTWGGHPLHGPVEITCLVVGITSILAARYLPSDRPGSDA